MYIYLVVNECTPVDGSHPLTEVVSAHSTLQKALDALANIAADFDVDYDPNETSIYVQSHKAFQSDEYYIEEIGVDDER